MSDIERDLARIAAEAALDSWSADAVELALRAIGDTVAVAVGGSEARQTGAVAASLGVTLTRPGLPVGSPGLALLDAAFLGGVAAHALDWDDYMLPMYGHCSAVLLSAAWTVGVHEGRSGRDLVEAFLAGYQVDYLVSELLRGEHYGRGWHATSTIGTLGAAAAAARLMRLDAGTTGHALAIASSLACGLKVNFGTGTKAVHGGAAARNGVQAALLARHGITGSPDWLCGFDGMVSTFGGALDPDACPAAWATLDQTTHGIETASGLTQKPYTCCGSCHATLDAVIESTRALGLEGRRPRDIEVHVSPQVADLMRVEVPDSPAAANYSLTWAVAAAAIDLAGGPAQFGDAALVRGDIHELRERVRVVTDQENSEDAPFAARVSVGDGETTREASAEHSRGHPSRPLTPSELRGKQHQALDPVLGEDTSSRLVALLERLTDEDLARVADVLAADAS